MEYRYLLRYEKSGTARYIGHIDFIRAFQRAMKRAGLPVSYAGGFNPRQRLSFALPLPVGFAGYSEYAEIFLTEPADCPEIIKRLNNTLPSGVSARAARPLGESEKGPASVVRAAKYGAELYGITDIEKHIANFIESGTDDAGRVISITAVSENKAEMILPQGNENNMKPEYVAAALHGLSRTPYDRALTVFSRLELYRADGGGLAPIFG